MWLDGANGGATLWGEFGGGSETVKMLAADPVVETQSIGNVLSEVGNLALEEVRRNSGESKAQFYGRFAKDWLARNPLVMALLIALGIGLVVLIVWGVSKLFKRKKKVSVKNRW
jgi:hypothetical protein